MDERAAVDRVPHVGAPRLGRAPRISTRLRPDGLVEVIVAGDLVGFVDYVAPVFVALAGSRPNSAVEVAQTGSLTDAVAALCGVRG